MAQQNKTRHERTQAASGRIIAGRAVQEAVLKEQKAFAKLTAKTYREAHKMCNALRRLQAGKYSAYMAQKDAELLGDVSYKLDTAECVLFSANASAQHGVNNTRLGLGLRQLPWHCPDHTRKSKRGKQYFVPPPPAS